MKGQGEVRKKCQGEVRMKGQGKVRRVEACLGMPGMSRHVPAESAADKPRRRPATKPTNQEPTRSCHCPIRS